MQACRRPMQPPATWPTVRKLRRVAESARLLAMLRLLPSAGFARSCAGHAQEGVFRGLAGRARAFTIATPLRRAAASESESGAAAGAGGGGGDSAAAPSGSGGDRLHSTDIAFKPNEDGWGYTRKYKNNWERIFGSKNKGKDAEADKK